MPPRAILLSLVLALAASAAATTAIPPRAVAGSLKLDRFGGLMPALAPRSRFFRVRRMGARWIFLTPAGGAFWLLGVFDIQPPEARFSSRFHRLFPSLSDWGAMAASRLRRWGFNTAAEYSSAWVTPISRYGPRNTRVPVPFVDLLRPGFYSLTNRRHYARGPVKNLVAGLDGQYRNYRGDPLPDVFDPNFAQYAFAEARAETTPALAASPWLLGTAVGDADDLWGFGPGGRIPTVPPGHASSNIGWIALCTDFQQTGNAALGVRYADPRVYTKYALGAFLRQRYHTIAALDRAWGATYTRFGDDGGYGHGTGLLDEDGRHRWIGRDDVNLGTARRSVRADLNAFLVRFADRYFSVTAAAVRRARPDHLVFGPATLNGWSGLTRLPILAAAARYDDVVQASFGSARVYELSRGAVPDRPFVSWMGFTANADSDLAVYPRSRGAGNYPSQGARAMAYRQALESDFSRPQIAGAKLWAWGDSWSEKANWGLVSLTGRPYDGSGARPRFRPADSAARSRAVTPPAAGSFLAGVVAANHALLRRFAAALRCAHGG